MVVLLSPRCYRAARALIGTIVIVGVVCAAASPTLAASKREADRRLDQRIQEAEQHLETADAEARVTLAKLLHLKGSLGDTAAAKRAQRMFDALRQDLGDGPVLLAYAGSAKMLQAKRTWLVWKKGKLVEEGRDLLNAALEKARASDPDAVLEVRFLRAVSADKLPDWMGQREVVTAEFAAIAEVVPDAVEHGWLSKYQASSALYHHARDLIEAGRPDAARPLLEQAIAYAPDSHAAVNAQQALAELD